MNKIRLLLPILIVLIHIGSINLFAQSSGKIIGTVVEKESGEAIPFANVYIEDTNIGSSADLNGNYVILNVPPGLYRVTASVVGFQKVTNNDVRVNVDFTTRLNFQLSIGAIDLEAVIVQGDRNPLIRQDLTNPTVSIGAENISELPVDQITDIIKLQAGVVTGNDGTIHVRGGRSNEIAFTLNGVSLNDPYGNQRSIGIATNAVQEVSVSTGTFSAQYGNALSGVVNYVTKEGSDKYSLSLRGYVGDFLTSRKELFPNIEDIDPINRGRMEATFGGPIPFVKDAKFYLSGVFENFKGSIYGQELYRPDDSYLSPESFRTGDVRKKSSSDPYFFRPYDPNSTGKPTGSGDFVAMNPSQSYNIQGNLSYRFSSTFKTKYEVVFDKDESKDYEFAYKYNPAGDGTSYSTGLLQAIDLTHTVGSNMFYTLKVSHGYNIGKYYLYESIDDPGYLPNLYSRGIGNSGLYSGGTSNYREYRKTTTTGIKGDLVAQIFDIHEVKLGAEARLHTIDFEAYSVEFGKLKDGQFATLTNDDMLYDSTLTIIRRIPTSPALYNTYSRTPMSLSAYLQDKIEFESSFILNAGVRYEMFDPAADYNAALSSNLTDSLSGFISAYNEKAKIKHTVSPRISMSYPITDRAIIRLSYGHFYQIGSLSSLYSNSRYFVTNVGTTPTFGNPNVEPQKSVQYEMGLQQQLTDDLKFDVTGYFKDVSNYIYTQSIYTASGRAYNLLTNLSYANSRGVTFSLLKRRSPGELFSASLDYTFSIAEGNRTEPSAELFFSEQSGKQSETYLVPLSFDRSHVINGTISFTQPDDWNLGLVLNLQTGTPYTPALPTTLVQVRYEQNAGNQPINWNVDMKFEKFFTLGSIKYSVFVQVENLFDTQNEIAVYQSSGRALSNVEQIQNAVNFSDLKRRIEKGDVGMFGIDQINGYYSNRPERVNRPREVRLGFSVLFN
jgi:outer membrane receptor protein involved in Fe transport